MQKSSTAPAAVTTAVLGLGLGLATALFTTTSHAQEDTVRCNENQEPIGIRYGSATAACTIAPAIDLDRFIFNGSNGDLVRIIVLSTSAGLDPVLELRDPQGTLVNTANSTCNGREEGLCSFQAMAELPTNGRYQISINDAGLDELGNYTLQLERLFPALAPTPLRYNRLLEGSISPATDNDFFAFEGTRGTQIRLNLASGTGAFDLLLEIRDPSGEVIALDPEGCDGGMDNARCSFQTDITLPVSGTYQMTISDVNNDEPGDYRISLQCLFGACPDSRPNTILNNGFEQ